MKKQVIGLALALGLGTAGWAANPAAAPANPPAAPMSKAAYKAAKAKIEAQRKADDKACKRLKDHARDLCGAKAEGREKSELARLQARYEPSPEATQDAKFAVAEANHDVAKVECAVRKGKAKDRCLDAAKAAREAAERQARVEKVDSTGGIFGRDGEDKPAKSGKS
jgi:hypothetical protein